MPEDLSVIVKRLRVAAGLTQEGLAERVGVSGAMVAHYESGKRGMSDDVAEEMVEALRLTPAERAELLAAAKARRPGRERSVAARLDALEEGQRRLEALVQEIAGLARDDRTER